MKIIISKRSGLLHRVFNENREITGMLAALLVLFLLLRIPFPGSLSSVGAGLLAVLGGMLVIWLSEAVGYSTSSFFLIGLMTLVIGHCRNPATNQGTIGTKEALSMALSGFGSEAWILVTAALILAAAFMETGLGERLVYGVLLAAGSNPGRILAGVLVLAFILSIFIPSQVANAALLSAVCVGIIEAYNISKKNNFAKSLLLLVAFGTGIAGMGIQTSGAPTIQTANYLSEAGYSVTWLQWATYGFPFAVASGAALLFLIRKFFPTNLKKLPGGRQVIRQKLNQLGPVKKVEIKLAAILLLTTFLWSTGQKIHALDSSTVAVLAVMAIFAPGIRISTWERMVEKINWGTLMLFGAAISLGQWLLKSGAADWVALQTIDGLNLKSFPPAALIGAAVFLFSLMSLTFSARAAAVAALVPAAIGFAEGLSSRGGNVLGMSMILYYTIQFSVLLPVNTPMSMIAYATETFTARDMLKIGIPLLFILFLLTMFFAATYWRWIGII
jgi:anion transporter